MEKIISMLLIAAMLAMPIGCGKDGNKDKDTTSGVETTDTGDDSAETDAPPKTPVPKEDKETKESDKDTDTGMDRRKLPGFFGGISICKDDS